MATQPYARIENPMINNVKGLQERINTPDKANANYLSSLVIPMRDDDADYPALLMANFIYGGGSLSSRLGTRVRQQEGLSYGVGSSFSASSFDVRATLSGNAICNPENIGRVEKVIAEELARLLSEGITEDELTQAKQGYLQAQKVSRSSDSALAGMLAGLSHAGRTMKYAADLDEKIASLTPARVNAAVRKHIDPKKLVVVSAGDFGAKTGAAP
jgi:zinc protease